MCLGKRYRYRSPLLSVKTREGVTENFARLDGLYVHLVITRRKHCVPNRQRCELIFLAIEQFMNLFLLLGKLLFCTGVLHHCWISCTAGDRSLMSVYSGVQSCITFFYQWINSRNLYSSSNIHPDDRAFF